MRAGQFHTQRTSIVPKDPILQMIIMKPSEGMDSPTTAWLVSGGGWASLPTSPVGDFSSVPLNLACLLHRASFVEL